MTNTITDQAKVERLALLAEEAGEVVQLIGKTLRHGWESSHPNYPSITNKSNLEEEIADLLLAVDLLIQEGDISKGNVENFHKHKKERKNIYLHHNKII